MIITNDDDQAEWVEKEACQTKSPGGSGLQDFNDLGYFHYPASKDYCQAEKFWDSIFETVDVV